MRISHRVLILFFLMCAGLAAAVPSGTYTANCTTVTGTTPFTVGGSYQFTITPTFSIVINGQTIPYQSSTGSQVYAAQTTGNPLLSATFSYASPAFYSLSWTSSGSVTGYALFDNYSAVAPAITSATTTSGVVGTAFSYQITASQGPTSFNATGLPAGLVVNTTTGAITGTPTTVATTNVTISATNATGTGSATLVLTVRARPAITSTLTATGAVSNAFTYQITASNTPTSYSATGLPAGLTVNTATGSITGTPSAAGTSNVTISATNAAGSGSATLVITVTVNHAPTISTISNVSTNQEVATASIPITVADQDGTSSLTVTATSGNITLIPNASLVVTGSGTTRAMVATPSAGQYGTSLITVTVSDGFLSAATSFTITVNAVNQAPQNTVLPTITGSNTFGQVLTASTGTWTDHETAAGSLVLSYAWLRADDTAGTNAATIGGATSSTYTVQAGDATKVIRVQVVATDGGYGTAAAASTAANSAWLASGAALLPPVVTSTLTATGIVGSAFSYQITGSYTPTSFNATGLPTGLSVNTSTGVVSGTPTTVGTSNVTISAVNTTGTGSATLVISIAASGGGGSTSSGGGGGGGCGAGAAAGLLLAGLTMIGLRRRR